MIREDKGHRYLVAMLTDIITVMLSYVISVVIRYQVLDSQPGINALATKYLLITLIYSFAISFLFLYTNRRNVLIWNTMGSLFFFAFLFAIGEQYFSRLALFIFWIMSSLLLLIKDLILNVVTAKRTAKRTHKRRLLLVGGGDVMNDYIRSIGFDNSTDFSIIGWVGKGKGIFLDFDFEKTSEDILLNGFLGGFEDLEKVIVDTKPDEVVFTLDDEELYRVKELVEVVRRLGIRASVVSSVSRYLPQNVHTERIDNMTVLDMSGYKEVRSFGLYELMLGLSFTALLFILVIKKFHMGYINTFYVFESYRTILFAFCGYFGFRCLGRNQTESKKIFISGALSLVITVIGVLIYETAYSSLDGVVGLLILPVVVIALGCIAKAVIYKVFDNVGFWNID